MKIATVVGARPQFIKAAAVHRAIEAHNHSLAPAKIHEVLIHTGQHYDANMSEVFFRQLGMASPDYQFAVGGSTHGAMTGRMLEQIEGCLLQELPDWVLVYGDTNSTLAGAVAAAKLCIPVAHVEAGLRSFNRQMPEEVNRILTDHCSDLLFTTHQGATEQLVLEGIPLDKIREVGDVMRDIARVYCTQGALDHELPARLGLKPQEYVLATVHRASNTDDLEALRQIIQGLREISEKNPVIFPLHPRTRQALRQLSITEEAYPGVRFIDPVGYLEMLTLESGAQLVITDSGGVQKEAYFCRVPCLILRDETEWTELVEKGYSCLVARQHSAIVQAYHAMLSRTFDWTSNLYGDGQAAIHIIQALLGGK